VNLFIGYIHRFGPATDKYINVQFDFDWLHIFIGDMTAPMNIQGVGGVGQTATARLYSSMGGFGNRQVPSSIF
jgi:hypothetical protein